MSSTNRLICSISLLFMLAMTSCGSQPSPQDAAKTEPSTPAAKTDSQKQVFVVVLSWFSRIGNRNCGSDYELNKKSGVANYPLPLSFELPKYSKNPFISNAYRQSAEFHKLQYRAAKEELDLMKGANFDVAVYDMLPMPDYDPAKPLLAPNVPFSNFTVFLEWIKAAEESKMKIGVFADCMNHSDDYPNGRYATEDEWCKILSSTLKLLPKSEAIWKVDGATGIMHFHSDIYYNKKLAPTSPDMLPDGGWRNVISRLRNDGNKFFFLADIRPHQHTLDWNSIADGVYIFAPASPLLFMTEYQKEMSSKFTIPYYWFVSSGNYRMPGYTEPDFRRIHETYLAAMKANAKNMVVESWNDMEEDHDIWPSANKGRCLLDVYSYYNQWFKSGVQPSSSSEKLIICYPLRIPETVLSKPAVWGNGKWANQEYIPKIFYWANLEKPRRVSMEGVNSVVLPAGLSVGELGVIGKISYPEETVNLKLRLDESPLSLPAIKRTKVERPRAGEGGLEFRYLDLLQMKVKAPDLEAPARVE